MLLGVQTLIPNKFGSLREQNCSDSSKNIGEVFANNTHGLRILKCNQYSKLKEEITYVWTYCNRLFIEQGGRLVKSNF